MANKVNKGDLIEFIRTKLGTNEAWAKKALLKIYDRQTQDEKSSESTHYHNNIGFTGADAHILSSFAKQLLYKKFLSPKQMAIVLRKMPKYCRQIMSISNPEDLERIYLAS